MKITGGIKINGISVDINRAKFIKNRDDGILVLLPVHKFKQREHRSSANMDSYREIDRFIPEAIRAADTAVPELISDADKDKWNGIFHGHMDATLKKNNLRV